MEIILCDDCEKGGINKLMCVSISFGYGSVFDDLNKDFCSDECCVNWITKRLEQVKKYGFWSDNPNDLTKAKKVMKR